MTHREILDSAGQTPERPAPSSANGTRPKSAGPEVVDLNDGLRPVDLDAAERAATMATMIHPS